MIRVILVDDHAIVRDGIKQIVLGTEDIVVAAEAADAAEAVARARDCACDLLVLDLSMPGVSGVELVERMHRVVPRLPILVLSMHNDSQIIAGAVKAGASGYVAKGSKSLVLLEAIRAVARGEKYLDPALSEFAFERRLEPANGPGNTLTRRELEILQKIAAGDSLGSIADKLHVSPKTVSTHKMRVMQKLKVSNNADLIRFALRHGLIE